MEDIIIHLNYQYLHTIGIIIFLNAHQNTKYPKISKSLELYTQYTYICNTYLNLMYECCHNKNDYATLDNIHDCYINYNYAKLY